METTRSPKASPDPLPELAAFLAPFAALVRRSPSRQSLERYVTGLLTALPRKRCATIAAALAGAAAERRQQLLTDATWDAEALAEARDKRLVAVSPSAGILAIDDIGVPKQGKASVGVSRQDAGTLGKLGNGQVAVTAEYIADEPRRSDPRHWPVSAQRYLPQQWAADAPQRERAHSPSAVTCQTKLDLALDVIDRARRWGVPFQIVAVDAGSGDQPPFLAARDRRELLTSVR